MTGIYRGTNSRGFESTLLWIPTGDKLPQIGLGPSLGYQGAGRYYVEQEILLSAFARDQFVYGAGVTGGAGLHFEEGAWSTKIPDTLTILIDEHGQIFGEDGRFKISPDGRIDLAHSERFKSIKSEDLETQNPFTDFSARVGKSSKGNVLAPGEFLARLVKKRGFEEVQEVPSKWKAENEKDRYLRVMLAPLHQSITDAAFGPEGHIHLVGSFVLKRQNEIIMSYLELGAP